MNYSYLDLSKMIDHSLLNPTLTISDLDEGINIAKNYDVASVCIMPFYTKKAKESLSSTTVKVGTTIGFPHGVNATNIKVAEAKQVIIDGAEELDMVVNISQILSSNWNYVTMDIKEIVDMAHDQNVKVKVIFENCYLNNNQKIKLCEICSGLNVDWVKTSTGYGTGGATLDDLKLMRANTVPHIQLKAAGGVRTLNKLIEVKEAGCTRAGATATITILEEHRLRLGLAPITSIMTKLKDKNINY